jgi:hypothetical protein
MPVPRAYRSCCVRKIWIDDALGRAAGSGLPALGQSGVAAFIVGGIAVDVQAYRIVRIVGLRPCRRCRRERPDRQNGHSQNAHQNLRREIGVAAQVAVRPEAVAWQSRAAAGGVLTTGVAQQAISGLRIGLLHFSRAVPHPQADRVHGFQSISGSRVAERAARISRAVQEEG